MHAPTLVSIKYIKGNSRTTGRAQEDHGNIRVAFIAFIAIRHLTLVHTFDKLVPSCPSTLHSEGMCIVVLVISCSRFLCLVAYRACDLVSLKGLEAIR